MLKFRRPYFLIVWFRRCNSEIVHFLRDETKIRGAVNKIAVVRNSFKLKDEHDFVKQVVLPILNKSVCSFKLPLGSDIFYKMFAIIWILLSMIYPTIFLLVFSKKSHKLRQIPMCQLFWNSLCIILILPCQPVKCKSKTSELSLYTFQWHNHYS